MLNRPMRILALASSLALSAAAVAPSTAQAQSAEPNVMKLTLNVGEQQVISADDVQSYSEGVRGVIDVRLTKDATQFVIVAQKPGVTSLLFIMMDKTEKLYEVTVVDPNKKDEVVQVQEEPDPIGAVDAMDNIRLDFYFVQLDEAYNHQLGVGWPGALGPGAVSATYDLQAGAFDSATAVVSNQALPRLDMAQATGWAKLMRQAAVVTANGQKATFMGGGEVNIPVQGSLTTGIHKISFGSEIEVLPRYDIKSGRIELQIHADVSDLADDRGTGTPGRITSTLDTVVNLELGQSLILAGLTASSEARSQTGLPLLSQIPILGALFGTNAAVTSDSENLIFIVPSVVDATTNDARDRIKEALELYEEYDGDLEDVNLQQMQRSDRMLNGSIHRGKSGSSGTKSKGAGDSKGLPKPGLEDSPSKSNQSKKEGSDRG